MRKKLKQLSLKYGMYYLSDASFGGFCLKPLWSNIFCGSGFNGSTGRPRFRYRRQANFQVQITFLLES